MVVLMAALMFFTSVLTPVHAESASEEPVETATEVINETPADEGAEPGATEIVEGEPAEAVDSEVAKQEAPEAEENSEEHSDTTVAPTEEKSDGTDTVTFDVSSIDDIVENAVESIETSLAADVNAETEGVTAENGEEPEIPDAPEAEKKLTYNGNGTSTLSLSVVGQADSKDKTEVEKANVIIVIDVSGSMAERIGWSVYTYSKESYNPKYYTYYGVYGYNNNTSPVERNSEDTGWVWSDDGEAYNGTVYLYFQNRLEATKAAACALAEKLLSNNKDETTPDGVSLKDIIEISVIKFANKTETTSWGSITNNGTKVLVSKSTTLSDIVESINGLEAKGGTNWQAALETAKKEADEKYKSETGETTSVIFLTDGMPTFYGNDTGYGQDAGDETRNNVHTCWNGARDAVRAVVTGGYKLYNIFAYGSNEVAFNNDGNRKPADYLKALTNYAYTGSGSYENTGDSQYTKDYFFDASDTSKLAEAFAKIAKTITNEVAFGEVSIEDGVSQDVTVTTLAPGKAAGFKYTVKDVEDGGETVVYTVSAVGEDNPTVTFYDAAGKSYASEAKTDDKGRQYYSATIDGKECKIALASVNDKGLVEWDLSAIGTLENGYEYTLSFIVWPDQEAYDYVAKLNNGEATWNKDTEQEVKDKEGNGLGYYNHGSEDYPNIIRTPGVDGAPDTYSILTNTSQEITYAVAHTVTDDTGSHTTYDEPVTIGLDPATPMDLTASHIQIEKVWNHDLDKKQLAELMFGQDFETAPKYTNHKVVLKVTTDTDKEGKTFTFPKLNANGQPVDKDNNPTTDIDSLVWSTDLCIAPGIMLSKDEATRIGLDTTGYTKVVIDGKDHFVLPQSEGHNYYVEEVDGQDLHFEYNSIVYHPMLVDGVMKNVKFGEDGTAEIVGDTPLTTIQGINSLKGGIDIKKYVGISSDFAEEVTEGETKKISVDETKLATDYNGEFAYTIKLTDADGNAVITPADLYTYSEPANPNEWSKDETDPNKPFWYKSGYMAYSVYDENGKRIKRAPITAAETVVAMPAKGYIRIANVPAGTNYEVTEEEDSSKVFNYLMTAAETKKGTVTTYVESVKTNTYSGKVSGNTSSIINYYNWSDSKFYVYHSKDCEVERIAFTDKRVKGTYDATAKKYNYLFDIYAETKPESLYGGYYDTYSGKSEGYDSLSIAESEWVNNKYSDAEAGHPYTPENVSTYKWTGKAYTTKGTEMHAEKDTTYFLKEVPECYLRPYTHWTYTIPSNKMTGLWFVSAIDDAKYKETGFDIIDVKTGIKATKVVGSFTVGTTSGKKKTTLTAPKVYAKYGLKSGYLAYYNAKSYIKADTKYEIAQYWITKDGIKVHGVANRTIEFTDTCYNTTTFK